MADNRVRILATLDDKVSGGLDKIRDRFDTLGKSKGFKAIAQGVGLGIGVAAWQMASSKIVDVLGDMVTAAIEDEASIRKLGAALKANIPDWDGNTKAIERTLKARMDLGFADDEQRQSLALLVAATGDATKALDIQRTAMDLARLKGISLAEASEALIKVEAGSYRILKSLGIELKDNATQTEALAAVQEVAEGQAASYAATVEGKLLVAQTKLGEKMEELGYTVVPALSDALDWLNDRLDPMSMSFQELSEKAGDKLAGGGFAATLRMVKKAAAETGMSMELLWATAQEQGLDYASLSAEKLVAALGTSADETEKMLMRMRTDFGATNVTIGKLGVRAGDTARDVEQANKDMVASMKKTRRDMASEIDSLIDEVYDPIILQDELAANAREQAANRAIADSKRSNKVEKEEAIERNRVLAVENLKLRINLLETGALTAAQTKTLFAELDKAIATSTGTAKANLITIRDQARALDGTFIDIKFRFSTSDKFITKWLEFKETFGFAEGGVVPGPKGAPVPAIVHGGETIIPNDYSLPLMPGRGNMGGGGITVNFNALVVPSPAQMQQVAAAIGPELERWRRRQAIA